MLESFAIVSVRFQIFNHAPTFSRNKNRITDNRRATWFVWSRTRANNSRPLHLCGGWRNFIPRAEKGLDRNEKIGCVGQNKVGWFNW